MIHDERFDDAILFELIFSIKASLFSKRGKLVSVTLDQPLDKLPAELEEFKPLLKQEGRQLDICLAPDETAMALLEKMSGIGLKALDIETRKSNLEDVFLGLTGKRPNGIALKGGLASAL